MPSGLELPAHVYTPTPRRQLSPEPKPISLCHPMGPSRLCPQPVATVPHFWAQLLWTSLCLLQHGSYPAGLPVTSHSAGLQGLCSELTPLPAVPCCTAGCAHSLSWTCCLLSTLALSFWKTQQQLIPTFVALSSVLHGP